MQGLRGAAALLLALRRAAAAGSCGEQQVSFLPGRRHDSVLSKERQSDSESRHDVAPVDGQDAPWHFLEASRIPTRNSGTSNKQQATHRDQSSESSTKVIST